MQANSHDGPLPNWPAVSFLLLRALSFCTAVFLSSALPVKQRSTGLMPAGEVLCTKVPDPELLKVTTNSVSDLLDLLDMSGNASVLWWVERRHPPSYQERMFRLQEFTGQRFAHRCCWSFGFASRSDAGIGFAQVHSKCSHGHTELIRRERPCMRPQPLNPPLVSSACIRASVPVQRSGRLRFCTFPETTERYWRA